MYVEVFLIRINNALIGDSLMQSAHPLMVTV
jgi:hypothetical protein